MHHLTAIKTTRNSNNNNSNNNNNNNNNNINGELRRNHMMNDVTEIIEGREMFQETIVPE